jgi:hypothetical protein
MSLQSSILNEVSRKKGTNLLMTLQKAQNIYNDYTNSSIEDYYNFMEKNEDFIKEFKEEIENEEKEINSKNNDIDIIEEKSQKMLNDVDSMLKEIKELKSKMYDFKISNKIKTKIDYLKFMNLVNLKTEGNINEKKELTKSQTMFYNRMEKNFDKNKDDGNKKLSQYKNYIISKENENEKNYKEIKEKLAKQKEQIKKLKKEKNENIKYYNNIYEINKDRKKISDIKLNVHYADNIDNIYDCNNLISGTGDKNYDKLLKDIKMADLQIDSYLKDIDECLEMNENIEKQLDNDLLNMK